MKCAIYARVSTEDQDCEIQLANLRGLVKRCDWPRAQEYVEKLSGKEGNLRPQLERLLEDARQRRIDVVVVWKMDRFGRSTMDTLTNIAALKRSNVRFWSIHENIDTDNQSPIGQFTLTIFAAIAELERAFILERTQTGFKAYRKAYATGQIGKTRHSKSGKDLPVGRPRAVLNKSKVRALRASGASLREIGKKLGCSYATVARILAV